MLKVHEVQEKSYPYDPIPNIGGKEYKVEKNTQRQKNR